MKKIASLLCLLLALVLLLPACHKKTNDPLDDRNTLPTDTGLSVPTPPIDAGGNEDPELVDPQKNYDMALSLLEAGDLYGAYDLFLTIPRFADVAEYLDRFSFRPARFVSQHAEEESPRIYEYEYDEYGRRLTMTRINPHDESKSLMWGYEYDEMGKIVRTYDKCDEVRYEYDGEGRPIRQIRSNGDTVTLEYDENGNIIRVENADGTVLTREYDAHGNLLREDYSLSDGTVLYTRVYEYNEQGDCIKNEKYEPDGRLRETSLYQYEYDEQGRVVKRFGGTPNGLRLLEEYEYDACGNQIKCVSYFVTGEVYIYRKTYDEQGNFIRSTTENLTGVLYDTSYVYDNYGNIVRYLHTNVKEGTYDLYSDSGYQLYYNPQPVVELPEEFTGKG